VSDVVCPACGEAEELRGTRRDDGVLAITCETCGASWERDTQRRCKLCGSTDLEYTPKPLWEKGRGDQRTPAGKIPAYACWSCGGRDVTSATPRPAADGGTP
jgi:hypothetical protein